MEAFVDLIKDNHMDEFVPFLGRAFTLDEVAHLRAICAACTSPSRPSHTVAAPHLGVATAGGHAADNTNLRQFAQRSSVIGVHVAKLEATLTDDMRQGRDDAGLAGFFDRMASFGDSLPAGYMSWRVGVRYHKLCFLLTRDGSLHSHVEELRALLAMPIKFSVRESGLSKNTAVNLPHHGTGFPTGLPSDRDFVQLVQSALDDLVAHDVPHDFYNGVVQKKVLRKWVCRAQLLHGKVGGANPEDTISAQLHDAGFVTVRVGVRIVDHTTTKPVCACPQQKLKESVEVAFAPNRPNYVHPSQAVVLPLVLKNVPTLEVSVYEVSTAAVYQVRGGRAVSRYCFKPGVLPWSCFRLQTRVNCKQAPSTCMALCLISAAPSRTITTPCAATLSPSSSQRWVPAVKLGTPRRQCVRTAALVCSCVASCVG